MIQARRRGKLGCKIYAIICITDYCIYFDIKKEEKSYTAGRNFVAWVVQWWNLIPTCRIFLHVIRSTHTLNWVEIENWDKFFLSIWFFVDWIIFFSQLYLKWFQRVCEMKYLCTMKSKYLKSLKQLTSIEGRKIKKKSRPKHLWNQLNQFHENIFAWPNSIFCHLNMAKNQCLNWGKSLKLPKMQFHEEKKIWFHEFFFCLDFFIFCGPLCSILILQVWLWEWF